MNRMFVVMALVVFVFGAGLLAGRWTAPEPVAAAPCPNVSPTMITRTTTTPEATTCDDQLAAAKALLAAQQRMTMGTPIPFPDELPADYTAATFEANLRRAVAECPDMPYRLEHVDCSEYPCLAWFERTGEGGDMFGTELGCPAWDERYPNSVGVAMTSDSIRVGDADRPYLGQGWWPPSGQRVADQDNLSKRLKARFGEGKDRLMDAWGGRELTQRESLEQSIRFFESAGADVDPAAAAAVGSLRRELAALPEDE